MKKTRLFILFAVFTAGIVFPALVLILIGATPRTILQATPVGQFVSSSASAGGFTTPGVTTVQTTRGSIIVMEQFSAEKGQPLVIVNELMNGLQLCPVGLPQGCADLMGPWAGELEPVPHAEHPFAALAAGIGAGPATGWLTIGVLISLFLWAVFSGFLMLTSDEEPVHSHPSDLLD